MRSFFRTLFNLYPGDGTKAIQFALLAFLWSFGIQTGFVSSNALLIAHVGANALSTVYMIIPCGMLFLSFFLIRAFHSIKSSHIFLTLIALVVCFYLLAFLCLSNAIFTNHPTFWYILRIGTSIFLTIAITCYWTFVNEYYHFEEAQRVYGFFSLMVFLGAAIAGFVLSTGVFTFPQLFLLVALSFSVAAYRIVKIEKSVHRVEQEEDEEVHTMNAFSLSFLFQTIAKSPFILCLIGYCLITFLTWATTEYNYMLDFQHRFSFDEAESAHLAMFLGRCMLFISLANIIISTLFYNRLLKHLGLARVLLICPILFVLNYSGWRMSSSLFFPVMGYFLVDGLLVIFDDSNFTLLLNSVPLKLRNKVRLFIESLCEPIGMFISGSLLAIPAINTHYLGTSLAFGMFVMALLVRYTYPQRAKVNPTTPAIPGVLLTNE